ncbi:Transmembrane exosortase [Novipirellula artificiosorum]|uniref:Transmembrane exosortase n=2 Tax=Novipirellula artificiosorum TaxID=2528016 RepID=A0A5C6CXF5_9BACT|nr:Transmembrane exosortase [Novipirellula artificiosorum]
MTPVGPSAHARSSQAMSGAVQAPHPASGGKPSVAADPRLGKPIADDYLMQPPSRRVWLTSILPAAAVFFIAMLYAYLPTLRWMEDSWRNEPDYSHGYLVLPLALFLLWSRRDSVPPMRSVISLGGLLLIAAGIGMRWLGRLVYADFLDGWSILLMVAGAIWFLLGWRMLRWSLPAVLFLFFMIPLPFQAESLLSWKLQGVATHVSTAMLRVLGQPAVSEAHIVWVNDERLMIEEACSGLRIFIGVAALAFFWASMASRTWLDRLIILAATVPLAIFVNALRIASIGVLYQFFSDPQIRHTIHDVSGYIMIPVAFSLLWLLKTYWEHLYRPIEQLTAKDFLSSAGLQGSS